MRKLLPELMYEQRSRIRFSTWQLNIMFYVVLNKPTNRTLFLSFLLRKGEGKNMENRGSNGLYSRIATIVHDSWSKGIRMQLLSYISANGKCLDGKLQRTAVIFLCRVDFQKRWK